MSQDGDIYAEDQLSREDALAGPEQDVEDELDRGYSPPEKPSGGLRYGTTEVEELEGETLEDRLEQEVPEADPYQEAADADADREVGGDLDAIDGDIDQEALDIDDDVAGDDRAGRLVDPDQDAGLGSEEDMTADDVGIDGAAAGAEEAAVHVIPEDEQI